VSPADFTSALRDKTASRVRKRTKKARSEVKPSVVSPADFTSALRDKTQRVRKRTKKARSEVKPSVVSPADFTSALRDKTFRSIGGLAADSGTASVPQIALPCYTLAVR
jgi:hypothetical protein